jgi:predicted nucleic acid-binding protein
MKVVSNTSPICYLLLIDQIHLLPNLFGEVFVPQAVRLELSDIAAPEEVRKWSTTPPIWLQVQTVPSVVDLELNRLHQGEREAILLAQSIGADLMVLDEKAARQTAKARGFNITGLLGILDKGAAMGLVEVSEAVARLQKTNFRASPHLLKTLLGKYGRHSP